VRRQVTSFAQAGAAARGGAGGRARAGEAAAVEDQAHTLKGAAGNIGATAAMRCARGWRMPPATGILGPEIEDDLAVLRAEPDAWKTGGGP
jgi:hypothetical protein